MLFGTTAKSGTGPHCGVGVVVEGDESCVPATTVVLAMGPWTSKAQEWLKGLPGISGHKYYSIVLRPSAPVPGDCLFTTFLSSMGGAHRTVDFPTSSWPCTAV